MLQLLLQKQKHKILLLFCIEINTRLTSVSWFALGNLAQGKPSSQTWTFKNRFASNANDGVSDTNDVEKCATAVAYHPYMYHVYPYYPPMTVYDWTLVYAWWQVDLQEWSSVNSVVIYIPDSQPG
jgi:hypothetical protein